MAYQLTGTVLQVWRAFGRVRFTVSWHGGQTAIITVPKQQFDPAIRKGDTVGTIIASPSYTAEDLLRWNAESLATSPVKPVLFPTPNIEPDVPPEERYYSRLGGPSAKNGQTK